MHLMFRYSFPTEGIKKIYCIVFYLVYTLDPQEMKPYYYYFLHKLCTSWIYLMDLWRCLEDDNIVIFCTVTKPKATLLTVWICNTSSSNTGGKLPPPTIPWSKYWGAVSHLSSYAHVHRHIGSLHRSVKTKEFRRETSWWTLQMNLGATVVTSWYLGDKTACHTSVVTAWPNRAGASCCCHFRASEIRQVIKSLIKDRMVIVIWSLVSYKTKAERNISIKSLIMISTRMTIRLDRRTPRSFTAIKHLGLRRCKQDPKCEGQEFVNLEREAPLN